MIGSNIIQLETTDSTNTYAFSMLKDERPPDGTVILTYNQTNGKGMDQNKWESEPGKNLTLSIVIYPEFLAPAKQFNLNQAISLGILDFVKSKVSGHVTSIKWPNDIYIGDRKVCGILIQHSILGNGISNSVIGIGLNVNQEVFISDAPNPVSLKMITGNQFELEHCLKELLLMIDIRYSSLEEGKHAELRQEYLSNLYRINQWHAYKVNDIIVRAMISGITEYGQLVIEDESGMECVCDVKEICYID
jgi:BirA family biotin operon repressor/biotin-[acetyl-CoA-carboxylase] ligase